MTNLASLSSYIDPGTGSMLFSLVVGLLSASYFLFRGVAIRAKFVLHGGKAIADADHKSIVIFSEGSRYRGTFEPICDELERRAIDSAYWTLDKDDPLLNRGYEHVGCEFIGSGNAAWARLNVMQADVCLATTPGLGVYQWKRSKGVGRYVHVMHDASSAAAYRMFGLDFFDGVLLTGAFQTAEIRELEHLRREAPKELAVVGCVYLDEMAMRASRMSSKQRSRVGGRRTVLLAPSWGPSSLLSVYGDRILSALEDTDCNVIVRPHPQSIHSEREILEGLISRHPSGDWLSWDLDTDGLTSLSFADVMITDFSGVVYDYAIVFDGPVIYAEGQFDSGVYDAAWFDHPLRKFDHFPRLGIPLRQEHMTNMQALIDDAIADESLAMGRRDVRDEVWQHRGEAATRVVDYLCRKACLPQS